MMYFLVVAGFVLLLVGAEIMLRGAIGLADKFGISKLVVGMTVIAFGTSAPELLVSLNAALAGSSGLAIGNVVGSNVANILLVLGVAGLLMPIANEPGALKRDGWMLLAGTGLFMALSIRGQIDLMAGLILLAYFIGFLTYTYLREKQGIDAAGEMYEHEVDDVDGVPDNLLKIIVYLLIGFTGLIYGADLLVEGGVAIARNFGVSEAVIGLTVIAFGTSLPELAASIVAAIRKHADVAVGNVVGSNIFNVVGIVGVVSLVTPMDVPARVINFDNWIMLAATLILMPYMIGRRERLGRVEAFLFLAAYLIYIAAIGYGVERLLPA
ncbi:MAG: calcium/sodium antiporter [Rhodospirillaceae bacterium]|jgi:cation:H+ antiporter|nr:calcium/sodium antiporter [Rhodospirillaceae bacterium]MBT4590008.1 calcium/sodium antiporter [Rhodospirillaceae bacterium]MBT4940671.1 calcium/sodium antiporter [Rhodospirillaceae bacterium]MBT5938456.1 calcium/sodium antiporter [Rhodospirillaceae bacterium]MBT7268041.1 calcium/sodium antiporter [Rhodospirillaceae bacterium]